MTKTSSQKGVFEEECEPLVPIADQRPVGPHIFKDGVYYHKPSWWRDPETAWPGWIDGVLYKNEGDFLIGQSQQYTQYIREKKAYAQELEKELEKRLEEARLKPMAPFVGRGWRGWDEYEYRQRLKKD